MINVNGRPQDGNIDYGNVPLLKFGRIPDIDAAETNEDVWDGTGAYVFPSAAATMKISSSSAADASAGTGLRTVRVFGLNASWEEVSVDVILDGQTGVTISPDLLRVYRAYGLTAGTGEVNAGNVWIGTGVITDGVPAVKYAGISAGLGQTLMAIYTVPVKLADGTDLSSGKIIRWYATCGAGQAAYATVALQTRANGGVWRTRRVKGIGEGGDMSESLEYGITVATKTDIRVRVLVNGVINSAIEAGFSMELRKA